MPWPSDAQIRRLTFVFCEVATWETASLEYRATENRVHWRHAGTTLASSKHHVGAGPCRYQAGIPRASCQRDSMPPPRGHLASTMSARRDVTTRYPVSSMLGRRRVMPPLRRYPASIMSARVHAATRQASRGHHVSATVLLATENIQKADLCQAKSVFRVRNIQKVDLCQGKSRCFDCYSDLACRTSTCILIVARISAGQKLVLAVDERVVEITAAVDM